MGLKELQASAHASLGIVKCPQKIFMRQTTFLTPILSLCPTSLLLLFFLCPQDSVTGRVRVERGEQLVYPTAHEVALDSGEGSRVAKRVGQAS